MRGDCIRRGAVFLAILLAPGAGQTQTLPAMRIFVRHTGDAATVEARCFGGPTPPPAGVLCGGDLTPAWTVQRCTADGCESIEYQAHRGRPARISFPTEHNGAYFVGATTRVGPMARAYVIR